MNRAELATFISEQMETSKAEADRFITCFTEAVYKNVKKDGVKITGFGNFSAVKRNARTGRNPQTGEELKLPAKWVPEFKAGAVLKESAEKSKK